MSVVLVSAREERAAPKHPPKPARAPRDWRGYLRGRNPEELGCVPRGGMRRDLPQRPTRTEHIRAHV
ncbi:hypothetical protein GN956_G25189 [Arapaima gigas]